MSQLHDASSEARFQTFVEELVGVIGHADRAGPLRDYCTGLLLPGERKSVEPMAADYSALSHSRAAPIAAAFRRSIALVGRDGPRQSRFVGNASDPRHRSDRSLDHRRHQLSKEGQAFCRAWRAKYSGQLGKRDNCSGRRLAISSQTICSEPSVSPIASICLRTGPRGCPGRC